MNKLIVLLVFLIVLFGGASLYFATKTNSFNVKTSARPTIADDTKPLNPHEIFSFVNDYRVRNDLKPLVWNDAMCKFANLRITQIETDYSHNGFKENVSNYIPNAFVGENITVNSNDQNVFDAWINSPDHRENILNPNYTDTCVGTAKYNYAVQEFAWFNPPTPTQAPQTNSDTYNVVMSIAVQNCLRESFQAVSNLIAQANANGAPLTADQIKNLDQVAENNCKRPAN